MRYSPWVSEVSLDQALHYEAGQDISPDDLDHDLVEYLEECEVGSSQQKDPQFRASVSPFSNNPFQTLAHGNMRSSCLGFESSGARLSLV